MALVTFQVLNSLMLLLATKVQHRLEYFCHCRKLYWTALVFIQAKPVRTQTASLLSQLSVTVPPLGLFYYISLGKQSAAKFILKKKLDKKKPNCS